jgi:hypothetical protein
MNAWKQRGLQESLVHAPVHGVCPKHSVGNKRVKHVFFIFALVAVISGCTAIRPAPRPTAEERLMQDGKLLYELGRTDEARSRLQLLLTETSDQYLRASAGYYFDRIDRGIPPEKSDPRIPNCWP